METKASVHVKYYNHSVYLPYSIYSNNIDSIHVRIIMRAKKEFILYIFSYDNNDNIKIIKTILGIKEILDKIEELFGEDEIMNVKQKMFEAL